MNVSVISNVAIDRRRGCRASVSMNTSAIANVATMQLIADYEKKAQHLWRCSAQYTLTQGSLHYHLATLGYQKRNTYSVEIFIL